MEFAVTDYREPSLVWYFRKHTRRFRSAVFETDIKPFMELPGPRFVVIRTELAHSLFPVIPEGWKTYSARGINISVGKRVDVTLLLKP